MAAEEEKEMGKRIAQGQKPDVGRMIADEIRGESVRQNVQREERGGAKQDNREPDYPNQDYAANEAWKKDWLENCRKVRAGTLLPTNPFARRS